MKTRKDSKVPSLVGILVSKISKEVQQEISNHISPQPVECIKIETGYWWVKTQLNTGQISYINGLLQKYGYRIHTIFNGNARDEAELRSLKELAKLLQVNCKETH